MKNLRKVLATITAISAICMSASAFAETTVTGAFDKAAVTGDYSQVVSANTVTATVNTSLATTGTQMTFVIMDADANELNLAAADILYIDQKELTAGSNSFTGVINPARITGATDSTIPDGSYIIKLGYTDGNGDFQIAKATMVVATTSTGTIVKFVFGDVNGGEYTGSQTETDPSVVTAADALDLLLYLGGESSDRGGAFAIGTVVTDADDTKSVFGDVNGGVYAGSQTETDTTVVTAADALDLLLYLGGESSDRGGAYAIGDIVSAVVAD